jgi:hypothetical protein
MLNCKYGREILTMMSSEFSSNVTRPSSMYAQGEFKNPAISFWTLHKGECSVCHEKFEVSPNEKDFKREMLQQFEVRLQIRHPRQWEFELKKRLKRASSSPD